MYYQKCVFADANASLDDSDFLLIGIPFDSTSTFRVGSREAPDAIRKASYNYETYNQRYNIDLEDLKICDLGNLEIGTDPGDVWDTIKFSASAIPPGTVPIIFGGEHSVAPPVIETIAADDEIGVVVFDAHLDLRDEYAGVRLSHACTSRRILDILGDSERYVSIGIRSGSEEEFRYAKAQGICNFANDDVFELGIDAVLGAVLKQMGKRQLYISIDFDVIDPAFAPGVGNPEPFGITPSDLRRAVEILAPRAIGLDITEINPLYDHGVTALLGARIAREFIAAKAAGPKP